MALQRLDHISIVVRDLDTAIDFFVELGMELEGRQYIEGEWAERVVGFDGLRTEIAMVRTPDGHSRIELTRYDEPAAVDPDPNAPPNTIGLRTMMFAVDDIEGMVARLQAHGGELTRDISRYEDSYLLCYMRGPDGILVALAEELTPAES